MSTWAWVAVVVALVLIVIVLVGTRRPRSVQSELDRPAKSASPKPARGTAQLSSGSLSQTSLATLLVGLQTSRSTGTLTVSRGAEVCSLYMLFGHLFHATCGATAGEEAVQEALAWPDGSYSFEKKATLPTAETVTKSLDEILASREAPPLASVGSGAPQTVDWPGLERRLEQLAEASLTDRSRKVKEILQVTAPNREAYIQTIDRIANTPLLFVDPARLTMLAGRMRRALDEVTG